MRSRKHTFFPPSPSASPVCPYGSLCVSASLCVCLSVSVSLVSSLLSSFSACSPPPYTHILFLTFWRFPSIAGGRAGLPGHGLTVSSRRPTPLIRACGGRCWVLVSVGGPGAAVHRAGFNHTVWETELQTAPIHAQMSKVSPLVPGSPERLLQEALDSRAPRTRTAPCEP